MVKTCLHSGCEKRANFNTIGEKNGLFCVKHKKEGMIDVISKTCEVSGCTTQAYFNTIGKKACFCADHKTEEMINVKNKTCEFPECLTRPVFNMIGEKNGLFCVKHKTEKMIDVKHKTCEFPECTKIPCYNMIGKKNGLYCVDHKTKEMIDVKNKTCLNDWCDIRVTDKYDGYCLFCFVHMFPDKPTSRNYKTKEFAVVEYVKTHFPDLSWITDKKIVDGCSKRRPDLYVDLGYQILIIEVDENQHGSYDCICENKRQMEISKDFGHRPIVFIRFNPDSYIKNNVKITSCWNVNNIGISVVKKSKLNEWEERLLMLKKEVDYWTNLENKTGKMIETIQLFYD